ncbi:MAG: hypothetical protein ABIJ84_03820 [bacterium]
MINLTRKDIIIPIKPPKLIVIVGPCRTGTTALANVFAKAGLMVYLQPIKSARRAKEAKEKIIPWEVKEKDVAVVKETIGAQTKAEFFDPIKILLDIGYPKEKLVLIPVVRDASKTLASWREMWSDLDLKKFAKSYELILDIKNQARTIGIKTIPYVHEAIRDNSSYIVIQKLIEVFATREEIILKKDFEELKEDFRNLQLSVDAYAVKADKYFQEMVMLSHKVDRHEKWLQKIADKIGIKLEY